MNGKELIDWREDIKSDLAEVKTHVKWIKENLGRLSHQQAHIETQVSWLKGVGSVVGIVLGAVLAFVTRIVMGD